MEEYRVEIERQRDKGIVIKGRGRRGIRGEKEM